MVQRFFWTPEETRKLPSLPEPVETFDPKNGETIKIRVERWKVYQHFISPTYAGAPASKMTVALRVWMQPGFEGPRAPYWDIHQGHLISALVPILRRDDFKDIEITITKRGVAPKAYFEILPTKVV